MTNSFFALNETRKIMGDIGGDISVYAENIQSSKKVTYNEKNIFPSASVIKLPILSCLYEEITDSVDYKNTYITFEEDDIVSDSPFFQKNNLSEKRFSLYQIAHSMITVSDNTSTNLLIDLLGMSHINEYIQKIGMSNTFLKRKMCDFKIREKGIDNVTTTEDIAIFFKYLLQDISDKNFKSILDIIFEQEDLEKIPSGFPEKEFKIANKPGELPNIRNDASLIYYNQKKYIINIFTKNVIDEEKKDLLIGKFARLIFQEIL